MREQCPVSGGEALCCAALVGQQRDVPPVTGDEPIVAHIFQLTHHAGAVGAEKARKLRERGLYLKAAAAGFLAEIVKVRGELAAQRALAYHVYAHGERLSSMNFSQSNSSCIYNTSLFLFTIPENGMFAICLLMRLSWFCSCLY